MSLWSLGVLRCHNLLSILVQHWHSYMSTVNQISLVEKNNKSCLLLTCINQLSPPSLIMAKIGWIASLYLLPIMNRIKLCFIRIYKILEYANIQTRTELSAIIKMFFCTVQLGSHCHIWLVSPWKVGSMAEFFTSFNFY